MMIMFIAVIFMIHSRAATPDRCRASQATTMRWGRQVRTFKLVSGLLVCSRGAPIIRCVLQEVCGSFAVSWVRCAGGWPVAKTCFRGGLIEGGRGHVREGSAPSERSCRRGPSDSAAQTLRRRRWSTLWRTPCLRSPHVRAACSRHPVLSGLPS